MSWGTRPALHGVHGLVVRPSCPASHPWHQVLSAFRGRSPPFSCESFQTPGDPDQTLCVYNAEPGSATAEALRLLSSWTTPCPQAHPSPAGTR
ncbi:MmyB family transcriptional regulator [Streptomyces buecherae]|uniref:MmyB family transcriptional regulator n=1 Tax=Streptomyces buecherae TaxID=2763006 RepID=UPI0020B8478F|nr:hypothetical protein [Streptomyces buecherae]